MNSAARYAPYAVVGLLVAAWLTLDPLGDSATWIDFLAFLAVAVPVYWISDRLARHFAKPA